MATPRKNVVIGMADVDGVGRSGDIEDAQAVVAVGQGGVIAGDGHTKSPGRRPVPVTLVWPTLRGLRDPRHHKPGGRHRGWPDKA